MQAAFARNRLVTLTGAGGSGKTRLAIEFAHNYATDPRNRVTFLPLETVHRPGEVADRLEIALGLSTAGGRSATRVVVDHLRYSPRLLVIDNCEHLVEEVAELASQILAQSPTSAILATSRENLALPEEYLFRLCPLEVPPPKPDLSAEEVLEFASVQLFAERAKAKGSFAIDRDATAIVEICRRLEGMPLAIELAAARLSHMPITALRDGLRDQLRLLTGDDRQAPPRQRTLEATLAWSYRLLTEAESVLLRRLGVFAGSFSLEEVQTVAAAPPLTAEAVPNLLFALLNKSLVVPEAARGAVPRYRLLEPTRAFVLRQLEPADEHSCRCRLLDYLSLLYEQSELDYYDFPTDRWLDLYAADWNDARAMLDWAMGPGDAVSGGQRLICALGPLLAELQIMRPVAAMEAAFARIDASTPQAILAGLHCLQAGGTALGSRKRAQLAREAVAIYRRLGDHAKLAGALTVLGMSLVDPDEMGPAEDCFAEAEDLLRRRGNRRMLASCYGWRAVCRSLIGDSPGALRLAEACLQEALETGCRRVSQEARAYLAELTFLSGRLEDAVRLTRAALEGSRSCRQTNMVFYSSARLGGLLIQAGDRSGARGAFVEALGSYTGNIDHWHILFSQLSLLAAQDGETAMAARFWGYVEARVAEADESSFDYMESLAFAELDTLLGRSNQDVVRLRAEGAAWNEEQAAAAASSLVSSSLVRSE